MLVTFEVSVGCIILGSIYVQRHAALGQGIGAIVIHVGIHLLDEGSVLGLGVGLGLLDRASDILLEVGLKEVLVSGELFAEHAAPGPGLDFYNQVDVITGEFDGLLLLFAVREGSIHLEKKVSNGSRKSEII